MMNDRRVSEGALNQAYLQRVSGMSDLEKQMYAAKDQGEAAVRRAKDQYNEALYGMIGSGIGLGVEGMFGLAGGGGGGGKPTYGADGKVTQQQANYYQANGGTVSTPYGEAV
jgi:hypothetical protein